MVSVRVNRREMWRCEQDGFMTENCGADRINRARGIYNGHHEESHRKVIAKDGLNDTSIMVAGAVAESVEQDIESLIPS